MDQPSDAILKHFIRSRLNYGATQDAYLYLPRNEATLWRPVEIPERVLHPTRRATTLRLALDLFLYTGVRRSDVVLLGPQMERDGWLIFTETKGRSRQPKARELPILPQLRFSIDKTPLGHLV